MHYSKYLLAALPLVAAAPIADPQYDVIYTTIFVTATGPAPTQAAASGHGHKHAHYSSGSEAGSSVVTIAASPSENAAVPATPDTSVAAVPSAPDSRLSSYPTETSSAISSSTGAPSSGSCGCPADTSGQYNSPGVSGNAEKSMLDSINCIRRMYSADATCLGWSPTLASASKACANAGSEDNLRANSQIVSDTGYGDGYFNGDLATTEFERSVFVLLCQSPDDTQLKGQCAGKVGEVGCSAGACTGHHDAVVDAAQEHKFMGAAANAGTKFMALSFSATLDIFG